MRFSKKELNARLKIRSASKKRKRSGSKEVVTKIAKISTMVKQMESVALIDSTLTTSMLEFLFGIIEIGHETKEGVSEQPIEARGVALSEAKFGGHPIEEGKVGPKEMEPLPTQGSTWLSMEKELA